MILIVDDKAENIFSLKKLLEVNTFDVDTALSGEEALKKVLKNSYELIILDVQMPGMDGFEVAEALTGYSKAKDIPIIFLSAVNTDKKFITKGYNSGGIDYVLKPVDPDILLLKVKTFCRLYDQASKLSNIQVALLQEIEVRKNAQNEQNRKTQELHSILESIPQIAFTANAKGDIEFVNDHWYSYSDNKNEFPRVYHNEVPISGFWKEAISEEEPFSKEVCIKKINENVYRYHLLKAIPVKEDGAIVKWVGTLTDIHEQKLANEILEQRVDERTRELQKINDALEKSNTDLQQFASVASHDLQEPLRKIQVFSSIVSERYNGRLEPGITEYLDKISASSRRMTKMINDLLNFSRLSVSNLFENADLNVIIQDILQDLELVIQEKKAVVNVEKIPRLDVVPGQIRQVFQNIIINALKFTVKDQAPVINIRAEIMGEKSATGAIDPAGDYCRITISDNGIGFNEIYLEKIFTIFQRLNRKEEFEGTGIGLAIAKKIVDKHNGIITAQSLEQQGATFIIVLPIHQTEIESNSFIK